jgi:leucine dehydrogenase
VRKNKHIISLNKSEAIIMPVFSACDFNQHERVVFCTDAESGLRAVIAIHNTALGPALGGCRMRDYISESDALTDVLRLSRGMTFKAAMAGIPYGGGKSVIIGDPRRDKNRALLQAMGRAVHALGGRYLTAEDVGTTVEDMDVMRTVTPFAHGVSDGTGNPSPATAYGVYVAIRAAVAHRLGRRGLDGVRVAVQGLGNVGMRLCEYLVDEGAILTVADINAAAVAHAVERFSATTVDVSEILSVETDILAPCALGAILDDVSVAALRAKIIAGAANNQLARPEHGEALRRRGILYAPDYVINAGGVIDIVNEGPNYSEAKVLREVDAIYDTVTSVFRKADAKGMATNDVADAMALARIKSASRLEAA